MGFMIGASFRRRQLITALYTSDRGCLASTQAMSGAYVEVHPKTAAKLKINDGERVSVICVFMLLDDSEAPGCSCVTALTNGKVIAAEGPFTIVTTHTAS